ncbi:MAG TPA: hypothetical protein VMV80_06145, partial [Anaerolineales bacterium]|nr:hypothetical protein [Anaerolineales bacterium]
MKRIILLITLLLLIPQAVFAITISDLTNNSGGTLTSGTLVIIDTANDNSFTTTTDAFDELMLGVIPFRRGGGVISIADGAKGPIQIDGVVQITCDEAITRGLYISTGSVAGQGTGDAV